MGNIISSFGSSSDTKAAHGLKKLLPAILLLVLAPLLALFLASFIFQTYEVEGSSMEKTLHNHDRLVIFKAPQSLAKATGHTYIPKRFDIIVFNHDFGGLNNSRQLIKRVIGLPGDRVVITDGIVTIFNQRHPKGFLVDHEDPQPRPVEMIAGYSGKYTVDADRVFVMGDNRRNSLGSSDFGTVAADDIVGKLVLRVYPFNDVQSF
jgi:signal peptidase I